MLTSTAERKRHNVLRSRTQLNFPRPYDTNSTFADQQLQAIAPTIAAVSPLVEAAGWATLGVPVAVGCASLGGVPCVNTILATSFLANSLVPPGGHEEMGLPPTSDTILNDPNGGYQGPQSAPISGKPPVNILPNTIIFPIIIF